MIRYVETNFWYVGYVETNFFVMLDHYQFLDADPLCSVATISRNFRGFYTPFSIYANEFEYVCNDRYESDERFIATTFK